MLFYKFLKTSPASGGSAPGIPHEATPLKALPWWTSLPPEKCLRALMQACNILHPGFLTFVAWWALFVKFWRSWILLQIQSIFSEIIKNFSLPCQISFSDLLDLTKFKFEMFKIVCSKMLNLLKFM